MHPNIEQTCGITTPQLTSQKGIARHFQWIHLDHLPPELLSLGFLVDATLRESLLLKIPKQ
jgi:hypothetical protein